MPTRHDAIRRRDEGRARVSRLTRWLAAGALVLTGACSVLAARILPGDSGGAAATATTSATATSSSSSSSNSDDGGLQPSAGTPSAASGAAHATSGGS